MLGFSAGLLKDQKPAVHLSLSPKKSILCSLKNIFLPVSLPLKHPGEGISMKNCRIQGCQKLQVLVQPNSGGGGGEKGGRGEAIKRAKPENMEI